MKKLTSSTIQSLVEQGTIRTYDKGQLILYEGDVASHIYFIYEGTVKVYDMDDKGNEKIINLFSKGDLFPLIPIVGKSQITHSFHGTVSEVKLVAIDRKVFLENLEKKIDLALYCVKTLSKSLRTFMNRIASMEKTDTKAKLYAALLFLSENHCKKSIKSWRKVNFSISQQFLADLVGVSRESINAAIKSAQDEKVIRSPKNLVLEINTKRLKSVI